MSPVWFWTLVVAALTVTASGMVMAGWVMVHDVRQTEKAMPRTIHVCVDVRGLLRGLAFSEDPWFMEILNDPETGKAITKEELFEKLCDELIAGHRKMPIGEPCDGFSYETGCPGHEHE